MSDSDEADCFGEQNPNGDTISSAEEHCSLSLDIIEDIKSQFFIEPSNTVEDPLEISLHTTAKGHFIEKSDSIRSPLDIKLRNMDRLLAINRQLVIYWNHWLVLETLKYLLRTSNTEDDLSLIVDRQDSDGDTAIFEICITVLRTRGGAFLEVKSFIKRITYIPRVKCVKFKNLYQCRIRHGFRTNYYLKVDHEQHLSMERLTNEKQDFWNFDCYIFKCLKMCESPDEIPTTMFICVLRSCHQFDNHKPYVMAKNCANVGVMIFPTLELDVQKTDRADPRFFRVTKTSNGKHLFESLIYKDYYLSWPSPLSNKLKLKKHSPVEMSMAVEDFGECHFEIINFEMIR
ncbi:uncharacterized protein LOC143068017 isoform X2 [Mytilus galloprovincialis]|uniref:uncharacterized protein LOC143068017 isoform X2 n=1 Tax=Mytilus galloprovincialis TaxID=29158 RepID=UPI003F7CA1CB